MIVPTVTIPFLDRRGSSSKALPREHQGTPLQIRCYVYCRGGACHSRNLSNLCRLNAEQINCSVGYGIRTRVYVDRLFCMVMYDGDKPYRTPKSRIDKLFSASCKRNTLLPQVKKGARAPLLFILQFSIFSPQ